MHDLEQAGVALLVLFIALGVVPIATVSLFSWVSRRGGFKR